jgi:hypothetical protein
MLWPSERRCRRFSSLLAGMYFVCTNNPRPVIDDYRLRLTSRGLSDVCIYTLATISDAARCTTARSLPPALTRHIADIYADA